MRALYDPDVTAGAAAVLQPLSVLLVEDDRAGGSGEDNLEIFDTTFHGNLAGRQGGAVWFDNAELSRLTSTAPPPNANFDGDNDVDGADFLTWQRNIGLGTTPAQGDANDDDVVNGEDFAIWKAQYGPLPAAAAVPEPATWMIAGMLGGVAGLWRRRS